MRRPAIAAITVLLAACMLARADVPKPAADLLDFAKRESAAKKKAIFVMFDASW